MNTDSTQTAGARRRSHRGYMLIVLAVAALALCGTVLSTQSSGQLYEFSSVNQLLLSEQTRWVAEGVLNYQIAVSCRTMRETNSVFSLNWNCDGQSGVAGVRPRTTYDGVALFADGALAQRDATLRFMISTSSGRESDLGAVQHFVKVNLVEFSASGSSRPMAERRVCRRGMFMQGSSHTGDLGSMGFFYSDY